MTIAELSPLLPLEGGFNLRDMGGYATVDGRRVKRGLLYRSGIMSMLSEEDGRALAALGIATVCDLRRPGERRRHPTRWCEPAGIFYWSRDYSESSGVLGEMLRGNVPDAATMRAKMLRLYRDILIDHAESYRVLFARLAGGHVPLLFNCSAGKDRTGVAAALILTVLGVPHDRIIEDYLLTNDYADFTRLLGGEDSAFDIDADVVQPLIAADPDYLAVAFDSLDRDHGGIDAYLATIGVDASTRATLQDLLLD